MQRYLSPAQMVLSFRKQGRQQAKTSGKKQRKRKRGNVSRIYLNELEVELTKCEAELVEYDAVLPKLKAMATAIIMEKKVKKSRASPSEILEQFEAALLVPSCWRRLIRRLPILWRLRPRVFLGAIEFLQS